MGFPVGSFFSSVTLMTARRAGRSDSRPGWPSTTCRAAMSSHGQSPARRRWGTVMASAAAAVPGRTWWTSKQASTADQNKTNMYTRPTSSFLPRRLQRSRCDPSVYSWRTASITQSHNSNSHSAPELIFKLYRVQKCASLSAHMEPAASPTLNWSVPWFNGELLSSVINVGDGAVHAHMHREDASRCVRSWKFALVSRRRTTNVLMWNALALRFNKYPLRRKRAGPGEQRCVDLHPYPDCCVLLIGIKQKKAVRTGHCAARSRLRTGHELTNGVRRQLVPAAPHFLDKSRENAVGLELQRLGYRLPPETHEACWPTMERQRVRFNFYNHGEREE